MPNKDEKWKNGRTRHVRVYLTPEEHALVRQAAALVDQPVSRFSIEAIVEAARAATAAPENAADITEIEEVGPPNQDSEEAVRLAALKEIVKPPKVGKAPRTRRNDK